MRAGNVSAGTITAATDMRAGNVSAGTITAATDIRAGNVSAGTISASTGIRADNVSASTISAATDMRAGNVSAATISAATSASIPTISATTISANTLYCGKSLTWALGVPSADTTGYNCSETKTITIPSTLGNLTNDKVTWTGGETNRLDVGGTISATSAIYSSDYNLKENIEDADPVKVTNTQAIKIKSFNFKSDETHRKMYGVIAQEVEAAGLGDLVVRGEDGVRGVDYTGLSLLKIAYLENEVKMLKAMINELQQQINK